MASPDHSVRIAEIQAILRSGADSISIDGQTVTINRSALQGELNRLMLEDPNFSGTPYAMKAKIGGI